MLLGILGAEVVLLLAFEIGRAFSGEHATAIRVPLSSVIAMGAFVAAVCAGVLSGAFCRMNVIIDLLWTRPVSRTRIALGIIGVDLAAIYAAWLISFALPGVALLLSGQGKIFVDDAAVPTTVILCGSLAAIYGVGIGISYSFRVKSPSLSPTGWGISLLALGVAFLFTIPIVTSARAAIRVFAGEATPSALAGNALYPLWGLGIVSGTIVTFALALAGIAATTYGWRRVQF